jgi:hypothetical protein
MSVPCLAILTQMQVSRRNVRSYLRINARVLSNSNFGRKRIGVESHNAVVLTIVSPLVCSEGRMF